MSSSPAIELSNVSKCYHTYSKPVHRLMQAFRKDDRLYEEFWALRDVSLKIEEGETVGIVGQNGSGKSTLLQLIVGTLTPTDGSIRTRGRISAILELGAGFNPEFTGIENARLNASIIGMAQVEIDDRMPDILAFSELGNFIDRPVKTYSSGMYIRLAFSVVINMDPDILVIDEALAVGDSRFQRKCFRKLDQLRNGGTTILFVTHATDTVISHCDRAVFMEQGSIAKAGEPKAIVNAYMESMFHFESRIRRERGPDAGSPDVPEGGLSLDPSLDACRLRAAYNDTEYEWGDGEARIIDFLLLDAENRPAGAVFESGCELTVSWAVHFRRNQKNLIYGLTIKTVDGTTVFGTNTDKLKVETSNVEEGETVIVNFHLRLNLISSEYFFSLGVVSRSAGGEDAVLHRRYDVFRIRIQDDSDAFGYAALPVSVTVASQEADIS